MPPRKAIAKMKSHSAESVDVDLQNCLLRIDKGTDVYGMLVIELDSGRSPKACELVGQNIPASNTTDKSRGKQGVYKNCRFSRLTKEGIQTGEVVPAAKPIPAAELEGEIGRVPHCYGAVSLCRSSTSFDGSQFFICLTSDSVELDHLNKKHVCFGRVVEGHDVLAALQSDLAEYSGDMGLVRKDCPYVMAELSYASM
ncbi:cyclophilin_8_-_putative [Leishmania major strain Friedlin]|nr:cyclophilin_8_-_putative [Leishmania major strain Friedlin]